jgi:hypothetical protein
MKRKAFKITDLVVVGHHEPWPINIGCCVRLNSGGPVGVVLELSRGKATVWWSGVEGRHELPACCLSSAVLATAL